MFPISILIQCFLYDLICCSQTLIEDARAMKSTGVVMEKDESAKLLISNLQDELRKLLKMRFGDVRAQYVHLAYYYYSWWEMFLFAAFHRLNRFTIHWIFYNQNVTFYICNVMYSISLICLLAFLSVLIILRYLQMNLSIYFL